MGAKTSVVVVTGAGSGIGRGICEMLDHDGYAQVLIGRSQEKLLGTAENLKAQHWILPADLTDPSALDQILSSINKILAQGFNLHGLVNNAGVFAGSAVTATSATEYRRQWENNFMAPVALTQKLLPILLEQKSGSIVNVSSTLALQPMSGTSAYSSAKAALQAWSEVLAAEVAGANVRVNCVSPGLVKTPIHGLEKLSDKDRRERIDFMEKMQPLGRMGTPNDIAALVHYLLSPASSWMTGSNIKIDGGISLNTGN
jgi:NAD(P)-dependent dehydrogenase (short-subunit alcohol dehydrogenase family)